MPDGAIDPESLSNEARELLLHLRDVGETSVTVFAAIDPARAERTTAIDEAQGAANELSEHDLLTADGASLRLTPAGQAAADALATD